MRVGLECLHMTTVHTPRGHAARYTLACYDGMRDDHARTGAYREAITAAAQGKVIIDLGTGALALLAIFAAEAGAKHVYAIEVQPVAAAAARGTINEAGLSDRITVIEGFSTDPHVGSST
jgi:type I protein arginine methyltransferase